MGRDPPTHPPTYCDVKIQVATSSGCPVTKLSVLLAGWVEFVNKYDAHPPSSRSLAGIVVGRPAGLLLMCVAGLLALQGGQPAVFIGVIFAASSARANLGAIGAQPADSRMGGGWVDE